MKIIYVSKGIAYYFKIDTMNYYKLFKGKDMILWSIIIGGLAGAIAKLLMPGRDPGGFIITILLGIVGAVIATFLGRAVGWYRGNESAGFLGAIVGAVILLAIYRAFAGRRRIL